MAARNRKLDEITRVCARLRRPSVMLFKYGTRDYRRNGRTGHLSPERREVTGIATFFLRTSRGRNDERAGSPVLVCSVSTEETKNGTARETE